MFSQLSEPTECIHHAFLQQIKISERFRIPDLLQNLVPPGHSIIPKTCTLRVSGLPQVDQTLHLLLKGAVRLMQWPQLLFQVFGIDGGNLPLIRLFGLLQVDSAVVQHETELILIENSGIRCRFFI